MRKIIDNFLIFVFPYVLISSLVIIFFPYWYIITPYMFLLVFEFISLPKFMHDPYKKIYIHIDIIESITDYEFKKFNVFTLFGYNTYKIKCNFKRIKYNIEEKNKIVYIISKKRSYSDLEMPLGFNVRKITDSLFIDM